MTDYSELVKALRGCKDIDYCMDCPRMEDGYTETCNIKDDAADAIEALQAEVKDAINEGYNAGYTAGIGYCSFKRAKQPHWVSMEERLPKRGEWIVDGMYTYNLRELNGEAYEPVYRCSCCNRQMESYLRLDEPKMPEDADFPEYCPHCGAKMTGEQDVE